ncbi:MAG TPA: hypothetical protein VIM16_02040 [Mucilaginibacter sp.]|jgi:hypothetical protein
MKILSYQSFSLYDNGGGSRILRRLYQGNESQVSSIAFTVYPSAPVNGDIDEKIIPLRPLTRSWMRWILRDGVIWLRENVFKSRVNKNIWKTAAKIPFDVLHVVDHGPFSTVLCNDSFLSGKSLWVSFHDHFLTTGGSFNNANTLWNSADRRMVISNELGNEYNRLFGEKDFEIITDGVFINEISEPVTTNGPVITIYFAGLLHIDYLPLFNVLANSLDILAKEGLKIKLILRGTQFVNFLDKRGFEIEYRPFSTDDDELKQELDSATILYLPIKFKPADFYLYSLSTKMIGYLGAPGSILYHGPADAAVNNLLKKSMSAVGCYTLDTKDVLESLYEILNEDCKVSFNAKKLAKSHFNFQKIKEGFWGPNYLDS